MSTDAITLLRNDHAAVRKLFTEFEKKSTTTKRKGAICGEVIHALTVHTFIEDVIMYPEVMQVVPDIASAILESYEEHHIVDVLIVELEAMKPTDERFEAKFTVLMENVRHHIEEEEGWFRTVRAELSRTQLQEMGARMLAERSNAPDRVREPAGLREALEQLPS